jgi:hypothetical protein
MKPTKAQEEGCILGFTKYVFRSPLKGLRTQFLKKMVAHRRANFFKKLHKPIELLTYISNGHSRLNHILENFG